MKPESIHSAQMIGGAEESWLFKGGIIFLMKELRVHHASIIEELKTTLLSIDIVDSMDDLPMSRKEISHKDFLILFSDADGDKEGLWRLIKEWEETYA